MPLGSSKNIITLTFFSFFYCRANGKSFPISILSSSDFLMSWGGAMEGGTDRRGLGRAGDAGRRCLTLRRVLIIIKL